MESEHLLLLSGVVAGPLFIAVFLMEGVLRTGYDPLRQPVSALSIGPRGWIQQANFFVTGGLNLTYAFGLSSALAAYGGSFWIPLLFGVYGAGLIGAGIFTTDVTGLMPVPRDRSQRTRAGILHDICSLPVFVALFALGFLFANLFASAGEGGWATYSIVSSLVLAASFVLAGMGFSGPPRLQRFGGLFQRISIIAGWGWLALVGAHLLGVIA